MALVIIKAVNFCGHLGICKIREFELPLRILAFCCEMPQI